jgi:hypothetical protein
VTGRSNRSCSICPPGVKYRRNCLLTSGESLKTIDFLDPAAPWADTDRVSGMAIEGDHYPTYYSLLSQSSLGPGGSRDILRRVAHNLHFELMSGPAMQSSPSRSSRTSLSGTRFAFLTTIKMRPLRISSAVPRALPWGSPKLRQRGELIIHRCFLRLVQRSVQ